MGRMRTPGTYPTEPTRREEDAPLVSVMVPVYNVERYLPQCLDSILAQDYQNLDILLVDDGSTDGCGAMCDSYASRDPRVRVLHTQNQGLAATRNVCLAHAIADLLLFVDADDWVEPNTVSTLVSTMHATGSDMVCCERIPEWQDSPAASARDDQPVRTLEGEKILAGLLRGTTSNAAWGKLCRAKVLLGIDYPNGHAYEDVFATHLICKQIQKVTAFPTRSSTTTSAPTVSAARGLPRTSSTTGSPTPGDRKTCKMSQTSCRQSSWKTTSSQYSGHGAGLRPAQSRTVVLRARRLMRCATSLGKTCLRYCSASSAS